MVFDYLDRLRELGIASQFGSKTLISVLDKAMRKGMTGEQLRKNMDRWARNIQKGKTDKLYLRK